MLQSRPHTPAFFLVHSPPSCARLCTVDGINQCDHVVPPLCATRKYNNICSVFEVVIPPTVFKYMIYYRIMQKWSGAAPSGAGIPQLNTSSSEPLTVPVSPPGSPAGQPSGILEGSGNHFSDLSSGSSLSPRQQQSGKVDLNRPENGRLESSSLLKMKACWTSWTRFDKSVVGDILLVVVSKYCWIIVISEIKNWGF